MKDRKLFWSGRYDWKYGEKGIVIGNKEYDFREMFPELYFMSCQGYTLDELAEKIPDADKDKACEVIRFLLDIGALTDNVQPPAVLFERQYAFYPNRNAYPQDMLMRNDLIAEFRTSALHRRRPTDEDKVVPLECSEKSGSVRRSTRVFDTDKTISFKCFSELLDSMRQDSSSGEIVYTYPSAGGLYPVDIYIFVKNGRVEGIDGGIYEYIPSSHALKLVSSEEIPARSHFFGNKEIFRTSAFSMYFFYNAGASMPKYHGIGYYYVIVDSGIMLGRLTDKAEELQLGSCIIGVFDMKKAASYLSTDSEQVYLHCMEFGIPKE